ncbi:MAG: DUF2344 domain-containing protein [Chloroflexi bacterium]|nr:DUF2344 domain-containing protein [Chloroflexota bacterium]
MVDPAARRSSSSSAQGLPSAREEDLDRPSAPRPVQRWRLVVGRGSDAVVPGQRELAGAWEAAFGASGLPLARTDDARARPRVSFGPALPQSMSADGELIDVVLTERWPTWRVRAALEGRLPPGWRLVDLYDVWLAGPPLAGRVAAADYRITLESALDPVALKDAAAALLAARRIPRQRPKGGATVTYDLRPLLLDVRLAEGAPPAVIETRTRFHPELGTGRPEEVLGALAERMGVALEPASIARQRLLLVEDLT